MQLQLNIENEAVAQKILWLLDHFKKDGLKILNRIDSNTDAQQHEYSDEYIKEHWRELVVTHEAPDIDDDDCLEQAHANWTKD